MTSDKCPNCGADLLRASTSDALWRCATRLYGKVGGMQEHIEQAPSCFTRQRDQLLARVKRLEEAGDRLQRIVGQKGDPQHWVDETECDAAVDGWTQAKEAQP